MSVAARRAVLRWAWRLFRRDWRQQILVLALLTFGVAAAVGGAAAAYNIAPSRDAEYGSANSRIQLRARDPQVLATDLAALRQDFGDIEVIGHQNVPVPGSVDGVDLRTQDPSGPFGRPMLALRHGRYPTGPGEIAATQRVARLFGVSLGSTVTLEDVERRLVGIVENPADLHDDFWLAAPSALSPRSVVVLADGEGRPGGGVLRSGSTYTVFSRGNDEGGTAAAVVLLLATVLLLLIALVAAAGFAVVAQRRLRQLGALGAIGATDRQLRLAVVSSGVVVGAVAAVTGTILGGVAWIFSSPRLERAAGHRMDRFDVPWWLVAAGIVLAVTTATAAAWWPARAASRIPAHQAISGRPPAPAPVHRSALAGLALVAAGFVTLAIGIDTKTGSANPFLLVVGMLAVAIGVLLFSPLAVSSLGAVATPLPLPARLALRDLRRYQARSGAALAAITLGLGIAVTTVVIAASTQAEDQSNLPDNQLLVSFGPELVGSGDRDAHELQQDSSAVQEFAAGLSPRAQALPLEVAVHRFTKPGKDGESAPVVVMLGKRVNENTIRDAGAVYVATPELLARYGIDAAAVGEDIDLITSESGDLEYSAADRSVPAPKTMHISASDDRSSPHSFITAAGLRRAGFDAAQSGWLVESRQALTRADIATARAMAESAGLFVEARHDQSGFATLRLVTTGAGIVLALCVLAMTVGLIRSEAGRDLRALAAAGATSATRRSLAAATTGSLALLGAVLGIAGAYLTLIACYFGDLERLRGVPYVDLTAVLLGLPVIAAGLAWLVSGREPSTLATRSLD